MRELILNNFWLKVFSLVLASVIWFVLQSNLQTDIKYPQTFFRPSTSRDFRCPVTLLVSSSNLQSYVLEPGVVTVRLHGDSGTINDLETRDVQAYVDLAALRDPEGYLKVEAIVPSKELTVRSISPPRVYVRPSG